MRTIIVVDRPEQSGLQVPGVEFVSANDYLSNAGDLATRRALVVNLCASYAYQRTGYYVSLLGSARGHRVMPDIDSLIDLSRREVLRPLTRDLQSHIDRALKPLKSDSFDLSIYFGRTLAARYETLGRVLDGMFRAPLLRAHFVRTDGDWSLERVGPIAWKSVPTAHHQIISGFAQEWLGRRVRKPDGAARAHLAILVDSEDETPPSDERALRRFERAAKKRGLRTERIGRMDAHRLANFDGLFIRTTTSVTHFTYRLARRAEAEGLVVVDDPKSIVRCGNKVFLAEMLKRRGVPCPETAIVHRDNRDRVIESLGLPLILKTPDGSFSRGVRKCKTEAEAQAELTEMLSASELVIAQRFLPTTFDWRVGMLGGRPLYACRYHMAHKHWQIIRQSTSGRRTSGRVDTLPLEETPDYVLRAAIEACSHIGDGLYGVDLKEHEGKAYLIEVNDNPNLDAGYEDAILGNELWERICDYFLEHIEARRNPKVKA